MRPAPAARHCRALLRSRSYPSVATRERTATMAWKKSLLASLAAAGLLGCSSPLAASHAPGARHGVPSASRTSAARAIHLAAEPKTKAGARAAAARYYRQFFSGQFSAAWNLLAPAARRRIPQRTWVKVHLGCSAASEGSAGAITSVTLFGDAAIVTQKRHQSHARVTRGIFNYVHGRWGYSPDDSSIYQYGSVAADIAAAKAHGLCSGRRDTTL